MTDNQYARELIKRLHIQPFIVSSKGTKTRKHSKYKNLLPPHASVQVTVTSPPALRAVKDFQSLLDVNESFIDTTVSRGEPTSGSKQSHAVIGTDSPPKDNFYVKIGENIRNVRERQRVTQEKLAEKAGIAEPSTVSRHERGAHITIEALRRYADALGVEVVDFIPRNRATFDIVKAFQEEFHLSNKRMKAILILVCDESE